MKVPLLYHPDTLKSVPPNEMFADVFKPDRSIQCVGDNGHSLGPAQAWELLELRTRLPISGAGADFAPAFSGWHRVYLEGVLCP